MNDHNLDDLIIGEPGENDNKAKGVLSIVALAIVVLLIGIFLAKLLFSSPEDALGDDQNAQTEIIGADLIPVETKKKEADTTPHTELSPIIKESLPPSQKDMPKQPTKTPETSKQPGQKEPVKTEEKPAPATETNATTDQAPTPKPATKVDTKPQPKATETTYVIQKGDTIFSIARKHGISPKVLMDDNEIKPNDVIKIGQKLKITQGKVTPRIKTETKPTVKAKTDSPIKLFSHDGAQYFIQIGAFTHDPSPGFLKSIADKGFKYVVAKDGNVRRVRVGPYPSMEAAKSALPDVHEKIEKTAFIVKKKQ